MIKDSFFKDLAPVEADVTCKIRVTRMCKIKSPILVTLLLCPAQVM